MSKIKSHHTMNPKQTQTNSIERINNSNHINHHQAEEQTASNCWCKQRLYETHTQWNRQRDHCNSLVLTMDQSTRSTGMIMSRADGSVRTAHEHFKTNPGIAKAVWDIVLDAGVFLKSVNDDTVKDIVVTVFPDQYHISFLNDQEMLVTKLELESQS